MIEKKIIFFLLVWQPIFSYNMQMGKKIQRLENKIATSLDKIEKT